MTTWNLGSVSDVLWGMIENIPSSISGTTMLNMIDQERQYMECFLSLSIGSTSIETKYQPSLISLSAASLLRSMELVGVDATSIKLGDFSENKGGASNVSKAANFFADDAQKKLDCLLKTSSEYGSFHFFKANG